MEAHYQVCDEQDQKDDHDGRKEEEARTKKLPYQPQQKKNAYSHQNYTGRTEITFIHLTRMVLLSGFCFFVAGKSAAQGPAGLADSQ